MRQLLLETCTLAWNVHSRMKVEDDWNNWNKSCASFAGQTTLLLFNCSLLPICKLFMINEETFPSFSHIVSHDSWFMLKSSIKCHVPFILRFRLKILFEDTNSCSCSIREYLPQQLISMCYNDAQEGRLLTIERMYNLNIFDCLKGHSLCCTFRRMCFVTRIQIWGVPWTPVNSCQLWPFASFLDYQVMFSMVRIPSCFNHAHVYPQNVHYLAWLTMVQLSSNIQS